MLRHLMTWVITTALTILVALSIVAVVRASADEGIGEGEVVPAYEVPAGAPAEPPPPEGQHHCPADPVEAAEVEYESVQLPEICRALADRLDRIRERAYWQVAQLLELETKVTDQSDLVEALRDRLDQIGEDQCEPECTVRIDPGADALPVTEASAAQYNNQLADEVRSQGEGSVGAIWFLIGLLAVATVAGIIWQTVRRGVDGR